MQQTFYELKVMHRNLDWLIDHCVEQSTKTGDDWDCIADDVTDALERIAHAMTIAEGNRA